MLFYNDIREAYIDSSKVYQYVQDRGMCKPVADSLRLGHQLYLGQALSSDVPPKKRTKLLCKCLNMFRSAASYSRH